MFHSRTPRILLSIALGFIFVVTVSGLRVGLAYWAIERDAFDPDGARDRIAAMTDAETAEAQDDLVELEAQISEDDPIALPGTDGESDGGIELTPVEDDPLFPNMHSPRLPDELFTSYLLVGSDLSGALADAIILVLLPEDDSPPILASLPRDLYLPSLCTDSYARINAALGGCRGVATGPELLSLTVEDFTGVAVDHFAQVDFSGFRRVVDVLGG
ncbi:MAG: LCP family protein, partial [Acidimicrobiia bacterium]|nr:LCP family protein [Acidimicrobiia bacterium]